MIYTKRITPVALCLSCMGSMVLTACSSGGAGSTEPIPENEPPTESIDNGLPPGEVTLFGAITVADDNGSVMDIIGSFFRLNEGVSGAALIEQFNGSEVTCLVEPDEINNFNDISASFIPEVDGISGAADAGETIVLSHDAGTYATLEKQGVGDFTFYGVNDMASVPSGAVPESLSASVSGAEFPSFNNLSFPVQTSLTGVNYAGSPTVLPSTEFSWDASADAGSMIRIFTSTNGGFFLENAVKVNCLVPDTGSFTFPLDTQVALGSDFTGGPPTVSRISFNAFTENDATLFLIRESFFE